MVFETLIRPLLFFSDAESMHNHVSNLMVRLGNVKSFQNLFQKLYVYKHPSLATSIAGLEFSNPVGLAPGFDKHCKLVNAIPYFGFSHIEVGTITAKKQAGNPKPRLFRIAQDRALVNRMGFNNIGADEAFIELKKFQMRKVPLGLNIGKSKVTPLKEAVKDYLYSFEKLVDLVDYVVVNVSSPNTPGLRKLQDKSMLLQLLKKLQLKNKNKKPVFVKIAPDLTWEQVDDVLDVIKKTRLSGIIATNTTISRDVLDHDNYEPGGISGVPLKKVSQQFVHYIYKHSNGKIPIIGVGGISNSHDAYERIKAGASLLQIYTGFVYGGPATVKKINKGLATLLKKDGFSSIKEAIGSAHKK